MPSRPLRHYYGDGLAAARRPDARDVVEPWLRHRKRFERHSSRSPTLNGRRPADVRMDEPRRRRSPRRRRRVLDLVDPDRSRRAPTSSSGTSTRSSHRGPWSTPIAASTSESSTLDAHGAHLAHDGRRLRRRRLGRSASHRSVTSARGCCCATRCGTRGCTNAGVFIGARPRADTSEQDELAVATWYSLLLRYTPGRTGRRPSPRRAGRAAWHSTAQVRFDEV